ncbi:hypothetical protein CEXT_458791 [Caerostris extrusa]|uniref:Uncharacterized protein n=1 Tax=Caerostris extrusa TaxID=172846 RepID=A0AAV4V261_CAEEX|nr:hypothetical protein CEXT_458791 [Caerostris extrusa]
MVLRLNEKQIADTISNFKQSKCEKLTRIVGENFFPFSSFVSQPSMQNVPSSIFKTDEAKLAQKFSLSFQTDIMMTFPSFRKAIQIGENVNDKTGTIREKVVLHFMGLPFKSRFLHHCAADSII